MKVRIPPPGVRPQNLTIPTAVGRRPRRRQRLRPARRIPLPDTESSPYGYRRYLDKVVSHH